MKKITVLGCGVIGLTTAICLERAGYKVRIISKTLYHQSTSAVAAAIWLPFKAEPIDLVNQWSLETYHVFKQLSHDQNSGVVMVDYKQLCRSPEALPWEAAIPASAIRKATVDELPEGYTLGYIAQVPVIETPIYLQYLFEQFQGAVLIDEVTNLKDLETEDDFIINCTGLGSRTLVNDTDLYPVKGQILKINPIKDITCAADDHPDHFFYIIPRSDCVVLGGSAEAHHDDLKSNKAITQTIFERTQKVAPQIKTSNLISIDTGLRPCRSSIRLEKERGRKLIHNYGHGGSGFTVSWGCANEVLKMVDES